MYRLSAAPFRFKISNSHSLLSIRPYTEFLNVVPANAGTHNHRCSSLNRMLLQHRAILTSVVMGPGSRPGRHRWHTSAFSRHDVPEVCMNSSPLDNRGRRECRALNAPAASHAVLRTKHTSVVTTVTPVSPGIPRAMVLRFPSCSPRCPKPSHRRRCKEMSRPT